MGLISFLVLPCIFLSHSSFDPPSHYFLLWGATQTLFFKFKHFQALIGSSSWNKPSRINWVSSLILFPLRSPISAGQWNCWELGNWLSRRTRDLPGRQQSLAKVSFFYLRSIKHSQTMIDCSLQLMDLASVSHPGFRLGIIFKNKLWGNFFFLFPFADLQNRPADWHHIYEDDCKART